LEELANELDGKLTIAKVNIDDNDAVAAEYGVRAIPTMILFKAGKVAETLVGMMPKAALKAKLQAHVA
jgi:thioredoxin 1